MRKKRVLWINLKNSPDTYFKFRFIQGLKNLRTQKEVVAFLIDYFLEKENLNNKLPQFLERV
jgi:hypothetical protein